MPINLPTTLISSLSVLVPLPSNLRLMVSNSNEVRFVAMASTEPHTLTITFDKGMAKSLSLVFLSLSLSFW